MLFVTLNTKQPLVPGTSHDGRVIVTVTLWHEPAGMFIEPLEGEYVTGPFTEHVPAGRPASDHE